MRITATLAGGFKFFWFREIVRGDPSLQETGVLVKVRRRGPWFWPSYEIIITPETFSCEYIRSVMIQITEIFRQTKNPFFLSRGYHHVLIAFGYEEPAEHVEEWRAGIPWTRERVREAFQDFVHYLKTHWDVDFVTEVINANSNATSLSCVSQTTSTIWNSDQHGVSIHLYARYGNSMKTMLLRLSQYLQGSLWVRDQ